MLANQRLVITTASDAFEDTPIQTIDKCQKVNRESIIRHHSNLLLILIKIDKLAYLKVTLHTMFGLKRSRFDLSINLYI